MVTHPSTSRAQRSATTLIELFGNKFNITLKNVPISNINGSTVDAGSDAAALSGGGPHQIEKCVSSLSDVGAADWSLESMSHCAVTACGTSRQSCQDSAVTAGCCCCNDDNALLCVSSVAAVDRFVKLPDTLRGTDVTDRDRPSESLLPGLETFVGGCDPEPNDSSHRLDNCEADCVGSDIGFGGSLKNVLRLSLTEAAILVCLLYTSPSPRDS